MAEAYFSGVSAIARTCQSSFSDLLEAAASDEGYAKTTLNPRDVREMQKRFDQWAGNLGVLQPFGSPLSLEHRLRDAPLVAKSIQGSLRDLLSSIQAANDICLGRRENRVMGPLITESEEDLMAYEVSSSESDGSSISSLGGGNPLGATSELREFLDAIQIGLDSLFRTSIFIRKFASKDQRERASKTKPFDSQADTMYVTDRYPLLLQKDPALLSRLGEANARRRQYFKYRRDHNDRLSTVAVTGRIETADKAPDSSIRKIEAAQKPRTEITDSSLIADTEATAFIIDESGRARAMGAAQAVDAMSAVSFATSIADTTDEELPFPTIPDDATIGSPFLCPYCLKFQQLAQGAMEAQWRKHVLQDLEPYICTFATCGLDTFQSQHTWFEHELLVHRTRWACSLCYLSFQSSQDLWQHVNYDHESIVADKQLSAFVEQSKRAVDSVQPSECPFCDGSWADTNPDLDTGKETLVVDTDQFRRHLGRHLQQVALFSLPRLIHDHDQSLNPHGSGDVSNRDTLPKAYRWIRADCGHGWEIISRKRETFIALASFLELYLTNRSPSDGVASDSNEGVTPSGLSEVYDEHSESEATKVDIVFVHGIDGKPKGTWTSDRSRVFWPVDLLPSFLADENPRILVYGYDPNYDLQDSSWEMSVQIHGELLMKALTNRRAGQSMQRPIIFVAHSLGGWVVKNALIHSSKSVGEREAYRSIYVSTHGILFLGTPHVTVRLDRWFPRVSYSKIAGGTAPTSPIMMDSSFAVIKSPLKLYYFHEGKPTTAGTRTAFIVDKESALPRFLDKEVAEIPQDHSHMCKFESENAPGFDLVVEAIQRYAAEAIAAIPARWENERYEAAEEEVAARDAEEMMRLQRLELLG